MENEAAVAEQIEELEGLEDQAEPLDGEGKKKRQARGLDEKIEDMISVQRRKLERLARKRLGLELAIAEIDQTAAGIDLQLHKLGVGTAP